MIAIEEAAKQAELLISADGFGFCETDKFKTALNVVGTHVGKMVTLLALGTLPPGEYATNSELAQQLNKLQGGEPGWEFKDSITVPFAYCKRSLAPLGFAEFGTKTAAKKRVDVQGVRLTAAGLTAGAALAGALLYFDLEAGQAPYAHDFTGSPPSQPQAARLSKLDAAEALLYSPGKSMTLTELSKRAGFSGVTLSAPVRELRRSGIIENTSYDECGPAAYTYRLADMESSIQQLLRLGPKTVAIIKTVLHLHHEGTELATGEEIITAAEELYPDILAAELWNALEHWVRQCGVPASSPALPKGHRLGLRLVEKHRSKLEELLRIRRLLTEQSPEADAFRAIAHQRARYIIATPSLVAQLLARAKTGTAEITRARAKRTLAKQGRADDWLQYTQQYIEQRLPNEGMELAALHRVVLEACGMPVSYKAFRKGLSALETADISLRRSSTRAAIGVVTLKPLVFPADWQFQAACKNYDTEIFFPVGTQGPAVRQAQAAKAVCKECPVRLACLRTAVDEGDEFGVHGGRWFELATERPSAEERERLRRVVHIAHHA